MNNQISVQFINSFIDWLYKNHYLSYRPFIEYLEYPTAKQSTGPGQTFYFTDGWGHIQLFLNDPFFQKQNPLFPLFVLCHEIAHNELKHYKGPLLSTQSLHSSSQSLDTHLYTQGFNFLQTPFVFRMFEENFADLFGSFLFASLHTYDSSFSQNKILHVLNSFSQLRQKDSIESSLNKTPQTLAKSAYLSTHKIWNFLDLHPDFLFTKISTPSLFHQSLNISSSAFLETLATHQLTSSLFDSQSSLLLFYEMYYEAHQHTQDTFLITSQKKYGDLPYWPFIEHLLFIMNDDIHHQKLPILHPNENVNIHTYSSEALPLLHTYLTPLFQDMISTQQYHMFHQQQQHERQKSLFQLHYLQKNRLLDSQTPKSMEKYKI